MSDPITTNTLNGLLVRNAPEYLPGLVNTALAAYPETLALSAMTVKGTTLKVRCRTNIPAGGFRAIGAPGAGALSQIELKTYDLKVYDGGVTVEAAYAKQHEGGIEMCIAEEQEAQLQGATKSVCDCLWNGATGGFPALSTLIAEGNVVNANGDTADGCSSAYLVSDEGADGFAWVMGQDGKLDVAANVYYQTTDTNGNDAFRSPMLAFIGWKLPNAKKAVRIANLDADHGLTDDLVGAALALLPTGTRAKLFCNSTQRELLRKSRTASNPTGAPATLPTESLGCQLFATDAITNTEAVVTFGS